MMLASNAAHDPVNRPGFFARAPAHLSQALRILTLHPTRPRAGFFYGAPGAVPDPTKLVSFAVHVTHPLGLDQRSKGTHSCSQHLN